MGKIIRHSYPKELSIGLLLLVFALSFFLSGQIFEIPMRSLNDGKNMYLGMFLLSSAVLIMVLILWEELLFPVKVKHDGGGVVFRNHRTKIINQALIYLAIPAIFIFIYTEYEVNLIRFIIWAAICLVLPVVGKLISGINNYNDFLKLTDDTLEYKNNKEVGKFDLKDIQHIVLVKDDRKVLHKIQLIMTNKTEVMIDLDEMELEAFFDFIDKYITTHYSKLLK